MNMVEKMKVAALVAYIEHGGHSDIMEHLVSGNSRDVPPDAIGAMMRAVLATLREPTEAMIDRFVSRALQVSVGGGYTWSDYARDQWQTMIDGAIDAAGES